MNSSQVSTGGSPARRPSVAEVNRMTKEQLKTALTQILSTDTEEAGRSGGSLQQLTANIKELSSQISGLQDQFQQVTRLIKEVDQLKETVEKQKEILGQQQRFLELIDSRERERNLIITGLSETEALDGVNEDKEKCLKVLAAAGVTGEIQCTVKRLGQVRANRQRPILMTVESRTQRDAILEKSKNLKNAAPIYRKIYVKKDTHPKVREEWNRLRRVEREEKARPENAGHAVLLDAKQRAVTRDGVVIDSWRHFSL